MKAPQIIYLVLMGINLLASSYMHGKERTGKYNVFVTLIVAALVIGLLYWGGFFS